MQRIGADVKNALFITLAFLATRLIIILLMPFVLDEALYSVMISEQSHHITLIPTFLGYPMSWKPAPFFWLYGLIANPLLAAGLPLEFAYRFPSLLFGLLSLLPVYLVLRKTGASKSVALLSLVVFISSGISIYPQSTLLIDAPLFLCVILSLFLYLEDRYGRWRFLAAGIFAFLAFFLKLVFAFIPPLLAIAWFYLKDKKTLRDPAFLFSLCLPFVAMVLQYALLQNVGLGNQLFIGDIGGHLVSNQGWFGQISGVYNSVSIFFLFSPIFIGLFVIGFVKYWRENLFMAFWACLTVIPLLSNSTMPWYFLPVLPAISFFSVMLLVRQGKEEKIDFFLLLVIGMLVLASLAFFYYIEYSEYPLFTAQKEAGMLISGKPNVLVIGSYKPSIIAYKMEGEYLSLGAPLDFGWIDIQENTSSSMIADFVKDYHNGRYNMTDGSFSSAFTSIMNFRKDTNLTSFDYIVVAGRSDYIPPDSTQLYNSENISVYKVG